MSNLTYVSGVLIPVSGVSNVYMNALGVLSVKHSDGSNSLAEPGSVNLSGLVDVNTPFVSGQLPVKSTSSFVPGTIGIPSLSLTIVSSGQVDVMDLLYSGVLTDGMVARTFVWSGIDQTYDHLELRGVARGNVNATSIGIGIYFNGDTTDANYLYARISVTTASFARTVGSIPYCAQINTFYGNETRGIVSPVHLILPNYSTSGTRKYIYTVGMNTSNSQSSSVDGYLFSNQWIPTAGNAINMMDVRVSNATDTFVSGTALYLWGHKRIWIITSGIYGLMGIKDGRPS